MGAAMGRTSLARPERRSPTLLRSSSPGRLLARAGAALAIAGAGVAAAAAFASDTQRLDAPFAAGNGAANVAAKSRAAWVMTRWVARRTGTLETLYLRMKTEGSVDCYGRGRTGYAGGSTGTALVTTHPVLPDGRPDLSVTLARDEFNPCGRAGLAESAPVRLGIAVAAGHEYVTIVRNVDPNPDVNYFSSNFLYTSTPLVGANGRNERDASAADVFYGLDPREIVGYSRDGGASWALPGGAYAGGFVPTYIQRYADGSRSGQPYYWAEPASGVQSMVFPHIPAAWTITHLGLWARSTGVTTVVLLVDGVEKAAADLAGSGMLRASIAPTTAPAGSTVTVRTTGGITLSRLHADSAWKSVLGLGSSFTWYDGAKPDGDSAVTVYPLPMYGQAGAATPTSSTSGAAGTATTTTTTTTVRSTTTDSTPKPRCRKNAKRGC